jgi:hypothetical protein
LMGHALVALHEVVRACEAAGPGATLAGLSVQLAQHPDAEVFAELIAQLMAAPEVQREGAEDDLAQAARKLRSQTIKKELDTLARSKDAATLQRMRQLLDEQKRLSDGLAH